MSCAARHALQCRSTLSHERYVSRKKLRNTKYIFWFSLQILSETWLIVRRNERDMIKLYVGLHVKCPFFLSDFKWNLNFLTDFWKILKYQISLKSVQWESICSMWTDGRTDMTKLIVDFRNFAKAPKKGAPWWLQKRRWWNVIAHCICVNMRYYIMHVTMSCVKCHHLCFFFIFGLLIFLQ
jgi:hypothetical protein